MAALVFAVLGLYSLNRTARDIVETDIFVINATNKLREAMLAQERYAGKYIILKSPEFRDLYNQKETEFTKTLGDLGRKNNDELFRKLVASYQLYQREIERLLTVDTGTELPAKKEADTVIGIIENIYASRQKLLNEKLKDADRREAATVRLTLILSFAGFLLALSVAILFIHNLSTSIIKLKKGMRRIAEGDFDYDPLIPTGDEIGDLAEDFTRMGRKLKDLEQMSLDASPLTRLPGNIAIERVLNRRLASDEPFAVCYADLDNFKAYNDRYGYIKASEVIKLTGEIIDGAVGDNAGRDSFVGHVGGDDFVMVVPAGSAAAVCEAVIDRFNAFIVEHYSPEDLTKGAIEGVDRYGVERTFPIMTISIAVLVCRKNDYPSATEIARTAASMKDRLKGAEGSNYLIHQGKPIR